MTLAALALPDAAEAAEAAGAEARWWKRETLTGDWGGARDALEARGVVPFARYTAGVWGNVRGGFDTGARYEGYAEWGLDFELEPLLEPLLDWPGARFHVGWHSYHGGQPSEDLVGVFGNNALFANEAEDSIRFFGLYLEQILFDGALLVRVGQFAVDDDFPESTYIDAFLNAGFGSFTSGRSELTAAFYPVAAPGLFVDLRPHPRWRLSAGVYTAEPGEDEKSNWGFDWELDEGASFATRVQHLWSRDEWPGAATFGVLATTRKLPDFEEIGKDRGGYSLFARIDQELWRAGDDASRLAAFVRGGFSPQEDRTVVRGYAAGGLVWYGPVPGRSQDLAAVGFVYTEFGDDFLTASRARGENLTGHEVLLELTYRIQLTGWMTVQPDLQVHFNPHFSRRRAVALGLQAVLTL